MPSLLQRERLPCGAAVRRFRARRAHQAPEARLRARQTQARQSRARRDDAPASRLHADRAARRAVHRGADVRHGLWSHQPGAHEPQLAAGTAGAAARAADGHARARAGLRATLAALTRGGWTNPNGLQRPGLQRVAYFFENGTLRREYWTVLDATQSNTTVK